MVRSWLRPDTLARLRWHQDAAHEVVLVSASFTVYLLPLARQLGVDGVLGTELAVGDDGLLTGALANANCRGAEKVRRLHAWLRERHGDRTNVELWAYGDSPGDRELLADADHAVWVRGPLLARSRRPMRRERPLPPDGAIVSAGAAPHGPAEAVGEERARVRRAGRRRRARRLA